MSSLPCALPRRLPWVHGLPRVKARRGIKPPPRNTRAPDMNVTGSILTATAPSHQASTAPREADDKAGSGRGLTLRRQPGKCVWAKKYGDSRIIRIERESRAIPLPFGGENPRTNH